MLPISGLAFASASPASELKNRFLEEAPQAWRELRQWMSTYTVTVEANRVSRLENSPEKRVFQKEYRFALCGQRKLVWAKRIPDHGARSVVGINDKYSFEVSREPNVESYYLTGHAPANATNSRQLKNLNQYLATLRASHTIVIFPIDGMLGASTHDSSDDLADWSSKFRLVNVQPVTHNNRSDLVRVSFKWFAPNRPSDQPYDGWWAILDPSDHWKVLVSEGRYAWGRWRREVEYQRGLNEEPFPKRLIDAMISDKGSEITIYRIDRPTTCSLPQEQFTLTAYGLPEIGSGNNVWSVRTFFLYANLVLIFLAFVGWAVWRWRKQDT